MKEDEEDWCVIDVEGQEVGNVAVEGVEAPESVEGCIIDCTSLGLLSVGTDLFEAGNGKFRGTKPYVLIRTAHSSDGISRIHHVHPSHCGDDDLSHLSPFWSGVGGMSASC